MKNLIKLFFIIIISCTPLSCIFANTLPNDKGCLSAGISATTGSVFIKNLQTAIKQNNKEYIANIISYPVNINKSINNNIVNYFINNKSDFLKNYDKIITEKTKSYITSADPNNIICTYQGAAIQGGIIWFSGGDSIGIFSINTM